MDQEKLQNQRHSLAHLLAAAVQALYPDAKRTIGPAIDNGFYYDFDFAKPITEEDLKEIESKMRKLLSTFKSFDKHEVSVDEAKKEFGDNPYKLELIEEFGKDGQNLTVYQSGEFRDLCRGGHSEDLSKIDPKSFKLWKLAGAYWRGDEKNKMLTRIYGLAFDSKEEIDAYLVLQEELKKRDHRKIAKEQDLIVFSDLVGSGMPMFTPKGNIIRDAIINYSRELNTRLGFGEVHTPNINKGELFKLSGHYDLYKADMLSVSSQYVSDEMFMKPMNCPQHTQIYASQPRSYRDLPIRYSDFANLYRDERPGELSGLTRLRAFAQDDGHTFCREDQIEDEISGVLVAIQEALTTYKVGYWMRLSLGDPNNPTKYLGSPEIWKKSEEIMRRLLKEKNVEFKEAAGEAAFYGPKIDIMAVDALGREWQISTIQLDFNMPARFKLTYTDSDGSEKTPVMVHRALVGSPDRFMGILIEHYAGVFPLWLTPTQLAILPVSDKHLDHAKKISNELKALVPNLRIDIDTRSESIGKKIRESAKQKIPYMAILGDKEIASGGLAIRKLDGTDLGSISLDDFAKQISEEIINKK